MKFLEFLYGCGKGLYGAELFNHLRGWDSSMMGFNSEYCRFPFMGFCHILVPAVLMFVLYYYIINHPRKNRCKNWLGYLTSTALVAFVLGCGFVMSDIWGGRIDAELANQIGTANAFFFGFYEALLATLLFFLLSWWFRHWSANCKHSPWKSRWSKSKK